MGFVEILVAIQIALTVLGFGGVVTWLHRQITALNGTISAHQRTIEAMNHLVNAIDAPGMLRRFEAYKKLVDHEKELLLKTSATQAQELQRGKTEWLVEHMSAFFGLAADFLPYVPIQIRRDFIERLKLPSGQSADAFKGALLHLSKEAPNLHAEATADDDPRHKRRHP